MQHRYVALIIFACAFATLPSVRTHASTLPRVLISEVQWGGSAVSTADEWIELANPSAENIDISSWKITGAASQGAEILIPPGTVLQSHTTYLVANYALGDAKTVLAVSPHLVSSSVSIANSELVIGLVDNNGLVVDIFTESDRAQAGSTLPHASAERDLGTGMWTTATAAKNMLTPDTFGSPGYTPFPEQGTLPLQHVLEEEGDALVTDGTEDVVVHDESSENLAPPEAEILPEETSLPVLATENIALHSEIQQVETAATPETSPEESTPTSLTHEETVVLPVVSEVVTTAIQDAAEDTSEEPVTHNDVSQASDTKYVDYSTLHVTEFMSSPVDGVEWVELWNASDEDLALDGLMLSDSSHKETTLSGTIDAHAYFIIENPKGKLNNGGDSITLTLPDARILFTLTYGTDAFPAPTKALSAGACSDGWHTNLSPSPAQENSCPTTHSSLSQSYDQEISSTSTIDRGSTSAGTSSAVQGTLQGNGEGSSTESSAVTPIETSVVNTALIESSPTPSSTASSKKKASTKNTVLDTRIDVLDGISSGQRVAVEGVVVAEPGVFGKRIAYLHGVQLYFHKATWPNLPLGTLVYVTGTWDYNGDNRRIKVSAASDITVVGQEDVAPLAWDDISSDSPSDILVQASGTLMKKEGETYIFSSVTGQDFRVVDTAKTGALTQLKAGDAIEITGLLLPENGTWILAPRTKDDLTVTPAAPLADAKTSASVTTISQGTSRAQPSTPLIGGGILASSVSALGYWFFRNKKLSFLTT